MSLQLELLALFLSNAGSAATVNAASGRQRKGPARDRGLSDSAHDVRRGWSAPLAKAFVNLIVLPSFLDVRSSVLGLGLGDSDQDQDLKSLRPYWKSWLPRLRQRFSPPRGWRNRTPCSIAIGVIRSMSCGIVTGHHHLARPPASSTDPDPSRESGNRMRAIAP